MRLKFFAIPAVAPDAAEAALNQFLAYGEVRYVALGRLRGRLHVLCFTETADGIRIISFRKANDREVKRHAEIQNPD